MNAEVREIVKAVAKEAAEEAVKRTLLTLGIDADNPLETQADMRHVREWRKSIATVKRQGLITAIAIITTGFIGLVWSSLSTKSS